jgi:hypothetical protein
VALAQVRQCGGLQGGRHRGTHASVGAGAEAGEGGVAPIRSATAAASSAPKMKIVVE